jgi:hypothetical protein
MPAPTSNKASQTETSADTLIVESWKYIIMFVYDFRNYVKNKIVVSYDRKSDPYKGANDFLAFALLSRFYYNIIIEYILEKWSEVKELDRKLLIFNCIIGNDYNGILCSIIHYKSTIYCFFSTLILIQHAVELQNSAAIQLLLDEKGNAVVKDYDSLFHLNIMIGNTLNDIKNNLPLKEELGYNEEMRII